MSISTLVCLRVGAGGVFKLSFIAGVGRVVCYRALKKRNSRWRIRICRCLDQASFQWEKKKGIRTGRNYLPLLISEAVFLPVFLRLSFSFSTHLSLVERTDLLNGGSKIESRISACQGQDMEHRLSAKATSPLFRQQSCREMGHL